MKQVYNVDPNHTSVEFAAKHMMVTSVRGRFKDFTGQVEVDEENPTDATVTFTINVASLDTGVDQRDQHLRSADFFDVEHHPEMRYASTKVESLGGNRYRVTGNLTIKDQVRPVTLDAEVAERFADPFGNERIGFSAAGKVNRRDWALTWNQVLEAGRLLVGDDIKLEVEGALVRKLAAPAAAPSASAS
jgi:polyisoprenoid-binding protein YceI